MECRFAARTLESDGLDLVAVKTAREGSLSPTVLFFLKTYGLGQGDAAGAGAPARLGLSGAAARQRAGARRDLCAAGGRATR